MRAWLKVVVAKHFYRHRYDYRDEWLRFTDTIGAPGAGEAPLEMRVTKAVADLTDSPAAILLTPDDTGLSPAACVAGPGCAIPGRSGPGGWTERPSGSWATCARRWPPSASSQAAIPW